MPDHSGSYVFFQRTIGGKELVKTALAIKEAILSLQMVSIFNTYYMLLEHFSLCLRSS